MASSTVKMAKTRRKMKDVCPQQHPIRILEDGEPEMSPIPRNPDDALPSVMECAERIVKMKSPGEPMGKGAYGEVRVLEGDPDVVVKSVALSPLAALTSNTPTSSFLNAFSQTDPDTQEILQSYVLNGAPELNEAIVHAYLSHVMEKQRIPPCIPAFYGSYVGLGKMDDSEWDTVVDGDYAVRLQVVPQLFIVMENLRPRLLGDMYEMAQQNNTFLSAWITCTFACLTHLYMRNQFVHGDLHMKNVLICKVPIKKIGFRIQKMSDFDLPHHIASYVLDVDNALPIIIDFGLSKLVYRKGGRDRKFVPSNSMIQHKEGQVYMYNTSDPNFAGLWSDPARLLSAFPIDHEFMQTIARSPQLSKQLTPFTSAQQLSEQRIEVGTLLHIALDNFATSVPIDSNMGVPFIYDVMVGASW